MTTGKPPQLPPKTLLGMPGDAEAALKKLQAEKQKAAQTAGTTAGTPARSQPPIDPQRTLYGNPHAAPSSSPGRTAVPAAPPKLPPSQPFRPPSAAPRSQPAVPAHVQAPTGMQRTQLGAPSDIEAALRHARPPASSGPPPLASQRPAPASQPTQAARPPAISPSSSAPAQPAVRQGQTVAVSASPQPQAPANSRSGVQRTSHGAQAPAKAGPSAAPSSFKQAPPGHTAHSQVARAALESTEPDRERESSRHLGPGAAAASMSDARNAPAAQAAPASGATNQPQPAAPGGMAATRLVSFEPGALAPQSTSSAPASAAHGHSPQLSLNADDVTARKPAPVKRWPALSLLGLAVVAFGGVIVVRAPQLLPAPLAPFAALVAKQLEAAGPPAQRASPPSQAAPRAEMAPPEGSATQPTDPPGAPAASAAPGGAVPPGASAAPGGADQAQVPATQPPLMAAESPAQPAAPGAEAPAAQASAASPEPAAPAAVPAAVQGDVAQLEKQAIDLLLANDYVAARAAYERLRAAEPARPEYSVMLDLLAREIAPACGGPGQVPCAQP